MIDDLFEEIQEEFAKKALEELTDAKRLLKANYHLGTEHIVMYQVRKAKSQVYLEAMKILTEAYMRHKK